MCHVTHCLSSCVMWHIVYHHESCDTLYHLKSCDTLFIILSHVTRCLSSWVMWHIVCHHVSCMSHDSAWPGGHVRRCLCSLVALMMCGRLSGCVMADWVKYVNEMITNDTQHTQHDRLSRFLMLDTGHRRLWVLCHSNPMSCSVGVNYYSLPTKKVNHCYHLKYLTCIQRPNYQYPTVQGHTQLLNDQHSSDSNQLNLRIKYF